MAASCACMLAGCATAPSDPQSVTAAFVGEWEVTPRGFYAENPDGSRTYPFGEDAVGRVIMTTTGYAANEFQRKGRSKCATGTSPMQCTTDEAAAAFKTAVAYQYRYTLEPDADEPFRGRILWKVDYVMYPNWQDQELPRRYEMSRDRQTWILIAPFPQNPKLAVKVHLQRVSLAGK
jgi:hypothetical protein